MTIKTYYDSAYVKEWDAKIVDTIEKEDGIYVILDKTAFYPHGGGQPCDLGSIQGVDVLDVLITEDQILHKVAEQPSQNTVQCRLDWKRRFDHMQQHSGQHLLSAVCLELLQAETLSFHMGVESCTIDVNTSSLTPAQMDLLEQGVNQEIYKDHGIRSYTVTEDEASRMKLVKEPAVTGAIRIVEIEGIEYNACGGTHVLSTGAIGMIKLLKAEKHKGNTRIYFKCGLRALAEFNDQQRILAALSAKFNTGKDEVLERIEKWENGQKQLQLEMAAVKDRLDEYTVRELLAEAKTGLIAHQFEDRTVQNLQQLANKLAAQTDAPVLLLTSLENKVVMAQSGKSGLSCGAFFKSHLGSYNGRGGGSDNLAQAGFSAWEDALQFYHFACGTIRDQFI